MSSFLFVPQDKGSVSVISSHHPCEDGNFWFNTLLLETFILSIMWKIKYFSRFNIVLNSDNFYLLSAVKCASQFCRETTLENNQILKIKVIDNLFILDQTKLVKIPLWIGHCHLCIFTFTIPLRLITWSLFNISFPILF